MKARNRKATAIAAVFLVLVLVYTYFLIWGHSAFRLVKETHANEITIEKILNDYPAKDSMQTNP